MENCAYLRKNPGYAPACSACGISKLAYFVMKEKPLNCCCKQILKESFYSESSRTQYLIKF